MPRPLTVAVLLAAACATATPPGSLSTPVAPSPVVPPVTESTPAARPPSPGPTDGAAIGRILEQSGLAYVTLEPGHRWMVAFAGRRLPHVVVYVVHGDEFTVVLGKLFTVKPDAGVAFYRLLARKNYDFDQLKLSVDEAGGVFASFEVPSRILDRRELLENIFGLAGAIDNVLPELVKTVDPLEDAPEQDEPAPAEKTPLPEATDDAIIEAMLDAPSARGLRSAR